MQYSAVPALRERDRQLTAAACCTVCGWNQCPVSKPVKSFVKTLELWSAVVPCYCTGLQCGQPKLQLAALSVVCCALAAPHTPLRDVMLADEAVAGALWPLLSHDSPGVRGKAAAAVVLMGRDNAAWLVEMCSSKVCMTISVEQSGRRRKTTKWHTEYNTNPCTENT